MMRDQRLELDSRALDGLAIPIAVVSADGDLVTANLLFSAARGLRDAETGDLSTKVREHLASAMTEGLPARCLVDGKDGPLIFDLIALPLAGSPALWLLVATETTLDVSMRNALVESRARYMDIVALSGESAWETTADGTFSFITPNGMAGFEPHQLIGLDPGTLLDPERAIPSILPFQTPRVLSAVDVWLRHQQGHIVCFEVSAAPLYGGNGTWQGARGICRDVTEARRNRAFLAELRGNERLLSRITDIFRAYSKPDDMLKAAAEACLQGLAASGCQIFGEDVARSGSDSGLVPLVEIGDYADGASADPTGLERDGSTDGGQGDQEGGMAGPRIEVRDGWSVLSALCVYGGRRIGVLRLWRRPNQPPWTPQEAGLIDTLAGHLAIAIEQRAEYARLLDASRTDLLTGILNRRAFDEELLRRLNRLRSDHRRAALLYIDLDNFKSVNDLRGHDVGDEALRHVGDILRRNTRSIDLLARLGGDEFAVWLEDVTDQEAARRAKTFLVAGSALSRYSGSAAKPLQMSIGIATYHPESNESIPDLMKRADSAMYQVKLAGKSNFAMAASPEGAGG